MALFFCPDFRLSASFMTIMSARRFAACIKSSPLARILRVVQESHDIGKARLLQADLVDRNSGIDTRLNGLQPLEML